MTRRCIQFVTVALLAVVPSLAEAQRDVTVLRPVAGAEPVAIQADSLVVNDADRTATFTGHAKIASGETHLTCSRVMVWYSRADAKASSIDRIICEP